MGTQFDASKFELYNDEGQGGDGGFAVFCRVVHDDTSIVLLPNVGHPIRRTMRPAPRLWPGWPQELNVELQR